MVNQNPAPNQRAGTRLPNPAFCLLPSAFDVQPPSPPAMPLPFPPQCILLVRLPWPTTTAQQIKQKRHNPGSWPATSSAPATKQSA